MRFTQLEAGQFNAGAVQWDIKGGDTFRSKIKQAGCGPCVEGGGRSRCEELGGGGVWGWIMREEVD